MASKSWWIAILIGIVVVGGGWFAHRWWQSPTYVALPLRVSPGILQREAEALRAAVEKLKSQAQEKAMALVHEAISDDYWSLQDAQTIPRRMREVVETLKTSTPNESLIKGVTFSHDTGQQIVVPGFSFDDKDLREVLNGAFDKKPTVVKEQELIQRLEIILKQQTQYDGWLDDEERDNILRFITTPEDGKSTGLKREVALETITRFCRVNYIRTGPKPEREHTDRFLNHLSRFMSNLTLGPYLLIVGSHDSEDSARKQAEGIQEKHPEFRPSYGQARNNKWFVQIGGYYSQESATALKAKAIELGLRSDSYLLKGGETRQ
jgi:hypothetical protein